MISNPTPNKLPLNEPVTDERPMRPTPSATPSEVDAHFSRDEQKQAPVLPDEDKVERPEGFVNDLTPEAIEELLAKCLDVLRQKLQAPTVNPNTVARILDRQHRAVSAYLGQESSLTRVIELLTDKRTATARRYLAALSPEERKQLIDELSKTQN